MSNVLAMWRIEFLGLCGTNYLLCADGPRRGPFFGFVLCRAKYLLCAANHNTSTMLYRNRSYLLPDESVAIVGLELTSLNQLENGMLRMKLFDRRNVLVLQWL